MSVVLSTVGLVVSLLSAQEVCAVPEGPYLRNAQS